MKRRIFFAALAAGALTVAAAAAAPQPKTFIYHTSASPRFGGGVPFTGELRLKVSPDGIINGTYRGTSIRPDPFYGRLETVTGGTSKDSFHFSIGIRGRFSFTGHRTKGGFTVSGWDSRRRPWDMKGVLVKIE